jgi:hypothetical protein
MKVIGLGFCTILMLSWEFLQFNFSEKSNTLAGDKVWQTLFEVTWYKKYNAELKVKIEYPKFSPNILALDGKEITITGFVIPPDLYEGDFVVLSAYPASSCFFCGGAGPETVLEVYPKNNRKTFATEKVTFKGKLKLNANDHTHLIYILQDAVQVYSEE